MEESSEDESVGASSAANDTEEESGGSSSENESERAGSKRQKLQGNEDRISALPDFLIHHLLSFLPSTKEAIQTGILSKRWQNQWTRVPLLIFDFTGKSGKNFSQFIDRTLNLHDCSKIKKFHIRYDRELESDPQLTSKIRFATRKNVEELILYLDLRFNMVRQLTYRLPNFLFNNASLVKLELFGCFYPRDFPRPNWPGLKELKLDCCCLNGSAIENVVSGSPLLESLELRGCNGFDNDVIASKSLKRLVFLDASCFSRGEDRVKISCPNLEELSNKTSEDSMKGLSNLPDQTIENVLSSSPLLHTLELLECDCFDRLVIASKSLKKLVLGLFLGTPDSDIEISCPDLEEVDLYRFVPLFFFPKESESRSEQLFAMKILGQVQHVKLLEIGSWFIKVLSALEVECLSSPLLNCKCLTLDISYSDEYLPGIARAINSSPAIEKLVIKLQRYPRGEHSDLNNWSKKNYWNSNGIVPKCSMSNLKTIKIVGLSERSGKQKLVLNFVEFVLKNAKVLEKIVVVLGKCGKCFLYEVSKKLLSFPRCSPHTTIELLSST